MTVFKSYVISYRIFSLTAVHTLWYKLGIETPFVQNWIVVSLIVVVVVEILTESNICIYS